ncbi:MAG: DUF378 domain-containing protein [Candidatus Terrybacteria bacterium]|nr:DUF378 domain-containing protein [Candidatus Terrybacteria bacterium]
MSKLNVLDWLAIILLVIGGLNWGLVGLINLDLVAAIFGAGSLLSRIIYIVVGLSAIYVLIMTRKMKAGQAGQAAVSQ